MTQSYSRDEMKEKFLSGIRCLVDYWSKQDGSDKDKLEGLSHSILCMIDGVSSAMPCAIDLVLRLHPDDKQYHIDNEEQWVEDGMCINDDVYLHEGFYK